MTNEEKEKLKKQIEKFTYEELKALLIFYKMIELVKD